MGLKCAYIPEKRTMSKPVISSDQVAKVVKDQTFTDHTNHHGEIATIDTLIGAFIECFETADPDFDRDKFLRKCGEREGE